MPSTEKGHPMPDPYKWTRDFQVLYEEIDEEHKEIFEAIFNIEKDPKNKAKLKACQDVIKTHFAHEEARMKRNDYEGYSKHKAIHDAFIKKLKAIKKVEDNDINDMKQWLCNHIREHDFPYRGLLPKP